MPTLDRRISLLDQTQSDIIVAEALKEILMVFKRVIVDHRDISEKHRSSILSKRSAFTGKQSAKKKLKALSQILDENSKTAAEKKAD